MEDMKNDGDELTNPKINSEGIVNQGECARERESRGANFYFDDKGKKQSFRKRGKANFLF